MSDLSYLPKEFIERMESDLGSDFHAFLSSYNEDKINALRLNPIKHSDNSTPVAISDMIEDKVTWCSTGYYYKDEARPGAHPYHHAGVYYIQDASAQAPVEMLSPKPGDYCLDLCAAPGGKSTQIAGKLMGEGLLVCNEPSKKRAKILSENVERLGIKNAIVTSEYPDKLATVFEEYFDCILVDAPCSGEGMFRKNHDACAEWSIDNVDMCADRQADILEEAYKMLIPGGKLCYSTCTFARAEDEEQIAHFLSLHEDMTLVEDRRLWPHEIKGEGHYLALMTKKDDGRAEVIADNRLRLEVKSPSKKELEDYISFEREVLTDKIENNLYLIGDTLYSLPDTAPDFKKLHVLRGGLFLGTMKKNRFEPGHALGLALKADEVIRSYNMSSDGTEIEAYMKGETINADVDDGWILMCVDGYSIGWGKASNGVIKNHYPKGLRKL